MAILIDLNQISISNLMQHINFNNIQIDENMVRHMILNSIRGHNKQFKQKYGKIIICCDNKTYWRKEVFPFYKVHRKRDRAASPFNWDLIFQILNKIRDELKEYSPYHVLDVNGAEADDIIGILSTLLVNSEPVMIISSDKDLLQLQKYKNVLQYSPMMKKFLKIDDPESYLKEHIIRGDPGDGIPNFMSPDNTFVTAKRSKRINTKKLAEWLEQDYHDFCTTPEMLQGYERNMRLIDLEYIPENIKQNIINSFNNSKVNTKVKFLDYMSSRKLKNLIEVITEF